MIESNCLFNLSFLLLKSEWNKVKNIDVKFYSLKKKVKGKNKEFYLTIRGLILKCQTHSLVFVNCWTAWCRTQVCAHEPFQPRSKDLIFSIFRLLLNFKYGGQSNQILSNDIELVLTFFCSAVSFPHSSPIIFETSGNVRAMK